MLIRTLWERASWNNGVRIISEGKGLFHQVRFEPIAERMRGRTKRERGVQKEVTIHTRVLGQDHSQNHKRGKES